MKGYIKLRDNQIMRKGDLAISKYKGREMIIDGYARYMVKSLDGWKVYRKKEVKK